MPLLRALCAAAAGHDALAVDDVQAGRDEHGNSGPGHRGAGAAGGAPHIRLRTHVSILDRKKTCLTSRWFDPAEVTCGAGSSLCRSQGVLGAKVVK